MNKVFVNSLPKAGTHLLAKCLELFGYSWKGHLGSDNVLGKRWIAKVRRVRYMSMSQGYIVGIDSPTEIAKEPMDRFFDKINEDMFVTGHVGYDLPPFIVPPLKLEFVFKKAIGA